MKRREFIQAASACALGGALARNGAANAQETGGRLAVFSCDVTPPLGTPIYSSYKPLATIEYPLLAKGIVLEDKGGRYVLCALDWCVVCNSSHAMLRRAIAEAAGTDSARVAVQTVHQHTAPIVDDDAARLIEALPNPPPYTPASLTVEAAGRVAEAVKQAVAKLEPFDRVGTGQAKVDRVASNRRVPTGDGKVEPRWSSCKDPRLIAMPEGLIDPYLKTISFDRGDRPLARLHYYATHPQSFYGDPRASWDFPGIARERLQQKENIPQIYFTGCAGNITAGKYNDGSPAAREQLAERLFAGMEASISATQYVPAVPLEWRTAPLTFVPREDGGYSEAECRANMVNAESSPVERFGGATGLSFRARAQTPFEPSALRMGNVQILNLPGESMIEYQLFAQESAPDRFVAVAAYGDCATGYICLERSFPEGGYEPSGSQIVPASEQAVRAVIRQLLGTA